ncbi:MAG: NeuD/PglB/VioB family sugar acetyltransferase [Elusimicrobium sp.]|jgi:sugar O-acyltransferase (sialic acid O-acetyltransferase NeuD family)|nr:NeuD/PglB/VioB family sugar acetyltransferase [Elusimicrobium sp.]
MKADKIILVGCGGHARSVADVLLSDNPSAEIIFVDVNAGDGEKIFGFPVLKKMPAAAARVHCAVGDNLKRKAVWRKTNMSVISKDAYISPSAKVGRGVFIGRGAHIGPLAEIGDGCIINTSCVIEHSARVGNFCHVSVGTIICGRVELGDNVFAGAGSVVKDAVRICSNVTVGAGAAAVKNIAAAGVYTGVPAVKRGGNK